MYFHMSCVNETVLFENWVVSEGKNLAVSCFLIFLIGVFYSVIEQALSCLRKLYSKRLLKAEGMLQEDDNDEAPLIQSSINSGKLRVSGNAVTLNCPFRNCYVNFGYVAESILLSVYYFYAYAMMLIFMTYQVHLCVSLCVGLATGFFFITGWQRKIGKIDPQGRIEQVDGNADYHSCCT